jgi:hypothetical protein
MDRPVSVAFAITEPYGSQGFIGGVTKNDDLDVHQYLTCEIPDGLTVFAQIVLDDVVVATSCAAEVSAPSPGAPADTVCELLFRFSSVVLTPQHYGVRYIGRTREGAPRIISMHPPLQSRPC